LGLYYFSVNISSCTINEISTEWSNSTLTKYLGCPDFFDHDSGFGLICERGLAKSDLFNPSLWQTHIQNPSSDSCFNSGTTDLCYLGTSDVLSPIQCELVPEFKDCILNPNNPPVALVNITINCLIEPAWIVGVRNVSCEHCLGNIFLTYCLVDGVWLLRNPQPWAMNDNNLKTFTNFFGPYTLVKTECANWLDACLVSLAISFIGVEITSFMKFLRPCLLYIIGRLRGFVRNNAIIKNPPASELDEPLMG
jgi:hypothetical protein